MQSASIYGLPKVCCNTNCKTIFKKSSFLGWCPRNEFEVYAILKCSKCKCLFKVAQNIMDAMSYYDKLPDDKKYIENNLISKEEMMTVKKELSENSNILNELNDGMVPGKSNSLKPKNDK